jgi:long-subunit acyl-CoA synthetase (AMP-forming)
MSSIRTSSVRRSATDHFEPQTDDPMVQRRLRGHLEQIDYAAFASNREVLARIVGQVDAATFQRMAVTAALARAHWVKEALALSSGATPVTAERIAKLAELRAAFEEIAEAYEGLRRMVERNYLAYKAE